MARLRIFDLSFRRRRNLKKHLPNGGCFFMDQTEVLLLSFSGSDSYWSTLVQHIFIEFLNRDYNVTNPKKHCTCTLRKNILSYLSTQILGAIPKCMLTHNNKNANMALYHICWNILKVNFCYENNIKPK